MRTAEFQGRVSARAALRADKQTPLQPHPPGSLWPLFVRQMKGNKRCVYSGTSGAHQVAPKNSSRVGSNLGDLEQKNKKKKLTRTAGTPSSPLPSQRNPSNRQPSGRPELRSGKPLTDGVSLLWTSRGVRAARSDQPEGHFRRRMSK